MQSNVVSEINIKPLNSKHIRSDGLLIFISGKYEINRSNCQLILQSVHSERFNCYNRILQNRAEQNRTDFIIQNDLNITVSRHYTQHTLNTARVKIQTYKFNIWYYHTSYIHYYIIISNTKCFITKYC
jgi:hypothetical protein